MRDRKMNGRQRAMKNEEENVFSPFFPSRPILSILSLFGAHSENCLAAKRVVVYYIRFPRVRYGGETMVIMAAPSRRESRVRMGGAERKSRRRRKMGGSGLPVSIPFEMEIIFSNSIFTLPRPRAPNNL